MSSFLNESVSDVVFVIDGQRVPAIKAILSLKSPVFAAMFSGNFWESKGPQNSKLPEIPVEETTVDAFTTMIRFIYTDDVVFKDINNIEHICDDFKLSDRYEILRLEQRVGQHLVSKINLKNLLMISRVVFTHKNEELMTKIITFIESNINQLIQRNIKELKELYESTDSRLLDVLTSDWVRPNDSLIRIVVKEKTVFVKKEALIKIGVKNILSSKLTINFTSFDTFKTFIGLLYFDKLILKDEEDFQLIQNVCHLITRELQCKSFLDFIGNHLKDRITVHNLESISEIAFDYNIKGLIERVNQFMEQNFNEIFAKSDEQLTRINSKTNDSLLLIILKNHRKCIQK